MADRNWAPLFFDLAGRRVVVVGGGAVAERKASSVAGAGATVTVIAPSLSPQIRAMAAGGELEIRERSFQPADLEDATIAFAATDDPEVNRMVAEEGRARRVPVNVADQPDLCDFIVPATFQRPPITVAFSTGGASPALARFLRETFEREIGPGVTRLAATIAALREPARNAVPDGERRAALYRELLESPVSRMLSENDDAGALEAVRAICQRYGVPSPAKIPDED